MLRAVTPLRAVQIQQPLSVIEAKLQLVRLCLAEDELNAFYGAVDGNLRDLVGYSMSFVRLNCFLPIVYYF